MWVEFGYLPQNNSKCKVMHIGRNNDRFQYFTDGHLLNCVNQEKDIGVQVTN